MAYIGQRPQVGNFVKIDDISSQFNGSTSTFNTLVGGVPYQVSNPYATVLALNNLLQQPGVSYNFNLSTISFATAPPSGYIGTFWCIVLGDVYNVGVPSNNTITTAMLQTGSVTYATLSTSAKATILSQALIFGS